MSNININKLKNFDAIGAARETKVGKSDKTDANKIQDKAISQNEDALNFSSRLSEMGKFVDTLRELPDIRQEKVESLRQQISDGEYNPSATQIADAILRTEN